MLFAAFRFTPSFSIPCDGPAAIPFLAFTMADDAFPPLARFHAGDRAVLTRCYEEYFDTVTHAVAGIVTGADRETVVQDVFFRMLTEDDFRRTFQGGSLAAWLRTVARNRAIDFRRRYYDREFSLDGPARDGDPRTAADSGEPGTSIETQVEARILYQRLRAMLPAKWLGVFEQRFIAGLSQREAALALDLSRTTLAYREIQIRRTMKRALRTGKLSEIVAAPAKKETPP